MKKAFLCLLLCLGLLLAACSPAADDPPPTPPQDQEQATPAPPPPPPDADPVVDAKTYTVDFSDGNYDFVALNFGAIGADLGAEMSIAQVDGENALRIAAPSGDDIYLGINVDGLLGDRVVDVKTAVFDIYAEFPDGDFKAQTGDITAYMGGLGSKQTEKWTIYIDSRNPNEAVFTFSDDNGFVAGGANIFEIARLIDRAATPAVIYIMSMTFYDNDNLAIAVDTNAGWAGPDGYAEPIVLIRHDLPYPAPHGDVGDWEFWRTPGTDDEEDDYLPWEILANSMFLVFEIDEAPDAALKMLLFGDANGWNWHEFEFDGSMWADGAIRINLNAAGYDLGILNSDNQHISLGIGNWGSFDFTAVYLEYIEPMEFIRHDLAYPAPHGDVGGWEFWHTPGTEDETDDYLPWEVLSRAHSIVFELEEMPEGGSALLFFGAANGWNWHEFTFDGDMWAGGKIRIILEKDAGYDVSVLNEDNPNVSIGIGNWNSYPFSAVYLELLP